MANARKIEWVKAIVHPYFKHDIECGFQVSTPSLEECTLLYFKKQPVFSRSGNRKYATKEQEMAMVEKIRDLHIGAVDIYTVGGMGHYIVIDVTNVEKIKKD